MNQSTLKACMRLRGGRVSLHNKFQKQKLTFTVGLPISTSLLARKLCGQETQISRDISGANTMLHRFTNNRFRAGKMATLESLNFDNLVLRSLPIDPSEEIHPRQVKGACFSKMKLSPVANPETVAVSGSALKLLDLTEEQWKRTEFSEFFGGNRKLHGSQPAAHCYCGHQFGYFAGQLGDGAAM